jgi:hypothetical protein
MIYQVGQIVSMVNLRTLSFLNYDFILADFTLNSASGGGGGGGGGGDGNNFLPWHTPSHPSLVAALQMNSLPLG